MYDDLHIHDFADLETRALDPHTIYTLTTAGGRTVLLTSETPTHLTRYGDRLWVNTDHGRRFPISNPASYSLRAIAWIV